jgi:DNA polymerase III alpha subunit
MAEPWDTLKTVFTPLAVLAAVGAIWKLLFSGRIDDVHAERDRAIEDRDRALKDLKEEREKHDRTKAHWKSSVIAQREARRSEEVAIRGAPSVPPLSYEEPTGRFYVDEAADQEYRRQSEERRVQLRREQEEELSSYNRDMKSPSPDPTKPLPRPPRLPQRK